MSITFAIHELLRTSQVPCMIEPDSTIQRCVHDRVKLVVCVVDGRPAHALLPASLVVNLERLLDLAGAKAIRVTREDELPVPRAADPIFVDVRLALGGTMVFTPDASSETLAVRWADFARSMRPIVGDFAEPPRDRVGAYRLSCRE
jgi:hypothetical protein